MAPSVGFCLLVAWALERIASVLTPGGSLAHTTPATGNGHGALPSGRTLATQAGLPSMAGFGVATALLVLIAAVYTPLLLQRDAEWADELALWDAATKVRERCHADVVPAVKTMSGCGGVGWGGRPAQGILSPMSSWATPWTELAATAKPSKVVRLPWVPCPPPPTRAPW